MHTLTRTEMHAHNMRNLVNLNVIKIHNTAELSDVRNLRARWTRGFVVPQGKDTVVERVRGDVVATFAENSIHVSGRYVVSNGVH